MNQDGQVSYGEFVAVMSGQPPSASLVSAPPVGSPTLTAGDIAEANLRRIMYASRHSLTQQFLRINANRSGFCEPAELARIFRQANLPISPEQVRRTSSGKPKVRFSPCFHPHSALTGLIRLSHPSCSRRALLTPQRAERRRVRRGL